MTNEVKVRADRCLLQFRFNSLQDERNYRIGIEFIDYGNISETALQNDPNFTLLRDWWVNGTRYYLYEGTLVGDVTQRDDSRDNFLDPIISTKLGFSILCRELPTWLCRCAKMVNGVRVILFSMDANNQKPDAVLWRGYLNSNVLNADYVDENVEVSLSAGDELNTAKRMEYPYFCDPNEAHSTRKLINYVKDFERQQRSIFINTYSLFGISTIYPRRIYISRNMGWYRDKSRTERNLFEYLYLSDYEFHKESTSWYDVFKQICEYLSVTMHLGLAPNTDGKKHYDDYFFTSEDDLGTFDRYCYEVSGDTWTLYTTSPFRHYGNATKQMEDFQYSLETSPYTAVSIKSKPKKYDVHEYVTDKNTEKIGYGFLRAWTNLRGDDDWKVGDYRGGKFHKLYYLENKDDEFLELPPCETAYDMTWAMMEGSSGRPYFGTEQPISAITHLGYPDRTVASSPDFLGYKRGAILAKFGEFRYRDLNEDNALENRLLFLNNVWKNLYWDSTVIPGSVEDRAYRRENAILKPFGVATDAHPNCNHYLKIDFKANFLSENMGDICATQTSTGGVFADETMKGRPGYVNFPCESTAFDYAADSPWSDSVVKSGASPIIPIPSDYLFLYLKCKLRVGDYWWNGSQWVYSPVFTTPDGITFDMPIHTTDSGPDPSSQMYNYYPDTLYVDFKPGMDELGYWIPIDGLPISGHSFDGKMEFTVMGFNKSPNSNVSLLYISFSDIELSYTSDGEIGGKLNEETEETDHFFITNYGANVFEKKIELSTPNIEGHFTNQMLIKDEDSDTYRQVGNRFKYELYGSSGVYITDKAEYGVLRKYVAMNDSNYQFVDFTTHLDSMRRTSPGNTYSGLTLCDGTYATVTREVDFTNDTVKLRLMKLADYITGSGSGVVPNIVITATADTNHYDVKGSGVYAIKEPVELTYEVASGHTDDMEFLGWWEGNDLLSTDSAYTFNAERDMTITARFGDEPLEHYTLTLSASPESGGTVSGGGDYYGGKVVIVSATPTYPSNFTEWTRDGDFVTSRPVFEVLITGDATYVAHFEEFTPPEPPEPDTFRISVNAHPAYAGNVSGGGVYESGETITLTQTANTGYGFVMWSSGGAQVSTDSALTITVTGDAEYTAEFSATPIPKRNIQVSASPASGGVVDGGGSYYDGDIVTLSQTANTDFTFVRWSSGGVEVTTDPRFSFEVSGDASYTAEFSATPRPKRNIIVRSNPVSGGVVSGGGSYYDGDVVTISQTANPHYTFGAWTQDGIIVSSASTYTFTVSGDAEFVANYAKHITGTPLNFTPSQLGTASGGTVTLESVGNPDPINIEYSYNNVDWAEYRIGMPVSLQRGETVFFRGDNDHFSKHTTSDLYQFVTLGSQFECSGNVMSLLDSDMFVEDIPCEACFASLFRDTSITTAPELPAKSLEKDSYVYTFMDCASLITAPALPATDLGVACYKWMFYGCTALKNAPEELPATTLARECYGNMFEDCTSLETAPELPDAEFAQFAYTKMFKNCSSLTSMTVKFKNWYPEFTAPNWVLGVIKKGNFYCPNELEAIYDESHIPSGWTKVDINNSETRD